MHRNSAKLSRWSRARQSGWPRQRKKLGEAHGFGEQELGTPISGVLRMHLFEGGDVAVLDSLTQPGVLDMPGLWKRREGAGQYHLSFQQVIGHQVKPVINAYGTESLRLP